MRWRVDELAPRDQRRWLGEPGRIPEGSDLASRLEARSRATVEAIKRWRLQKKGTHHALGSTAGTAGARATGGAGLAPKYAQLVAAGQGGRPLPRRRRTRQVLRRLGVAPRIGPFASHASALTYAPL